MVRGDLVTLPIPRSNSSVRDDEFDDLPHAYEHIKHAQPPLPRFGATENGQQNCFGEVRCWNVVGEESCLTDGAPLFPVRVCSCHSSTTSR